MNKANQKTLFINTNRYCNPPVIPLAVEYLTHALRSHSIEVNVLDLCFSSDPLSDIEARIREVKPEPICLTIRNVDSVLYPNTDYFLPEIKSYVLRIRKMSDAPVIIGGAALSADPSGILEYVGADIAVCGPGEETLPEILKEGNIKKVRGVIQGRAPESFCPKRRSDLSYTAYIEGDGIPGFETHKGCSSNCIYCMEAGTSVQFRDPSDVICELHQLTDQGYRHLHLCDSEFNENLDYSIRLLETIKKENMKLRWALYMKPGMQNAKLFELLAGTGAYLITLSVDTFHKHEDYWKEIASMVSLCKKNGIRVSIDFLTGFPYEDSKQLSKSLDYFRKITPDEVVVNVFLRLYKNLKITKMIEKDPSLKQFLIFPKDGQVFLLGPTFYNHVPVEKLNEWIDNDPLFRVAGAEKVVNYQKSP